MPKNNATLWLITVVAITFIMSGTSWVSLNELISNNVTIEKRHRTIEVLQNVLLAITDIEDGARGYVLSGEEPYLTIYDKGREKWRENYRELSEILDAEEGGEEHFTQLEQMIDQRIKIAESVVETRKAKGFDAAVKAIRFGKGHAVMENIREHIHGMSEIEHRRRRIDSANSVIKSRQLLLLVGSAIVLYAFISTFISWIAKNKQPQSRNANG